MVGTLTGAQTTEKRVAEGPSPAGHLPPSPRVGLLSRLHTAAIVLAAMMAWSGQAKVMPPFSWIPIDFTLFSTGMALAASVAFAVLSRSFRIGRPLLVSALLLTVALAGTVSSASTDYGSEKVFRLFAVSLPVAFAMLLIIRDQADAFKFIKAIVGMAVLLSAWIVFGGVREYGDEQGRLVTSNGASIYWGLASALVLVAILAWLLTTRELTPLTLGIAAILAAFHFWTMLAVGSRGPMQSFLLATAAMLALQVRRLGMRSIMRMAILFSGLIFGLIAVWSSIPAYSKARITDFSGGRSATSRQIAWSYTWDNLNADPFGYGWGTWPINSGIEVVYPHNIFLEVWFEAGVIGLLALGAAIWIPLRHQLRVFAVDRFAATIMTGIIVINVGLAQTSSDVNGIKLAFAMLVAGAAAVTATPRVGIAADQAAAR